MRRSTSTGIQHINEQRCLVLTVAKGLLDAVAPGSLLDKKVTGSDRLHPDVLNAIHSTCRNASAKLANLRRERVIMTSLNKSPATRQRQR